LVKSARETLQTLLAYVRDGAVIVLEENGATTSAFENGGFTFDPPAQEARRYPSTPDYAARAAANAASLREYNDAIDARIERERLLNSPSFEDTMPLDMSFLLSDCFYQYERDMDICNALAGMMGSGMRGLALCKQNAFEDYQTCRGF